MKIIIYDFDGTLTSSPIPKYEIIEKCKKTSNSTINIEDIIKMCKKDNQDIYIPFYKMIFDMMKKAKIKINDKNLSRGADKIKYNKGLEEYFAMLKKYSIENYILSSGIKVYIENTKYLNYFKDIYATTFTYSKNKEVEGVDILMTDKRKVTAIKEIMKKNHIEKDNCQDIVYIGDGLTDYYAMKYVKKNGGKTIFVYNKIDDELYKKMSSSVSLFTKADYSKHSNLYNYIEEILQN